MAIDPLEGCDVVAFDLETTGISTRRDRIVQYAVIGADASGAAIDLDALVDPGMRIPAGASRIHGILDADVRGAGRFIEHADALHEALDGRVIVGHNVRSFDLPMLRSEYLRIGRTAPEPRAVLDTLEMTRRLRIPRPHNLGSLCARHQIDLSEAHTASADAAACLLLMWRFMRDHPARFRGAVEAIDHWLVHGDSAADGDMGPGLRDLPSLDPDGRIRIDDDAHILAFGRHRGLSLTQVHAADPDYLRWLLSPGSVLDEATIDVLRNLGHGE